MGLLGQERGRKAHSDPRNMRNKWTSGQWTWQGLPGGSSLERRSLERMTGMFQGGDEASRVEKRCRGGKAAASVGDWQENTKEIPSSFWHRCLCRWNRALGISSGWTGLWLGAAYGLRPGYAR